jgi:hypothetical protein
MVGIKIDKDHFDLIIFEFQRYFRPQPFPKHYPTWLAQESENLPYQRVDKLILQNEELFYKGEQIFVYFESAKQLYLETGEKLRNYFLTHDIVDTLYENCEMYFFNKTLNWCIVVMDHPNERQALFSLLYRHNNSILYPTKELGNDKLVQILNSFKRNRRKQVALSSRYIRKIPTMITLLEDVIDLDFSYNWLEILPESITALPLKILKISANPLRELPKNLSNIKTLQELHLSGVQLANLNWELIGNLENLQKLYISYSGLVKIPTAILRLKNLKVLDISFNDIEDFSLLSKLKLEDVCTLGNT